MIWGICLICSLSYSYIPPMFIDTDACPSFCGTGIFLNFFEVVHEDGMILREIIYDKG